MDEDAITDQHICVPRKSRAYSIDAFNAPHQGDDAFIRLSTVGTSASPMRIGRLDGNSFRIVIRNLPAETAKALADHRHNHFFLNYYDTQRFGVPAGPKTTHLIGEHLMSSEPGRALELVQRSGTSEAERARHWTGSAEEFFAALDSRVLSFYYSACASRQWNRQLASLLDSLAKPQLSAALACPTVPLVTKDRSSGSSRTAGAGVRQVSAAGRPSCRRLEIYPSYSHPNSDCRRIR